MNNSTVTPSGVRREVSKGPIGLDRIYKADFQKEGTLTAQIRQEVTTKSSYPSKKTSSSMQANVFATEEFGFSTQDFEATETRIAWIPVPVNATIDVVKAKLEAAAKNGATIYRVLSNAPILDENQKYAINQGLKTKDDFAKTQAVRYPDGDPNAGKLTLDKNGNVQYRRTFFWLTPMEDQDVRGQEIYVSAELKAEMSGASVMTGQTI